MPAKPVPLDDMIASLAATAVTYRIAPGTRITAVFDRREQRNAFRDRYHHARLGVAGQAVELGFATQWVDEHGYSLTLAPAL